MSDINEAIKKDHDEIEDYYVSPKCGTGMCLINTAVPHFLASGLQPVLKRTPSRILQCEKHMCFRVYYK